MNSSDGGNGTVNTYSGNQQSHEGPTEAGVREIGTTAGIDHFNATELPVPGSTSSYDSREYDCNNLEASEKCPFPGHDAFELKQPKKKRLHNQVQLSTYGDAIHGGMPALRKFMSEHLEGVVKGLHILPFYPSSGDGGFAPINYKEVNPDLGTWNDIHHFAETTDLELELMVNHISPESVEFQDFIAKGDDSEFADMFIDWDKFWPGGDPSEADLELIRTRKPERPVLEVTMKDGSTRRVWCTFGPQQIDIDAFSKPGKKFVVDSLRSLCEHGAKIVRLDAFGYCTKKIGTRCFMEEPETWELLEDLNDVAGEYGTRLLCEVHEEFKTNLNLASRGYWVYDFALPLLVINAFKVKSGKALRNWLRICPRRQFTVLDTHDGLGIDDIEGLASVAHIEQLQETLVEDLGALPNYKYKRVNGEYEGFPHQYNTTWFSAIKENPKAYLLARAIQFWTPGVPMVYYVGLLAGVNDPNREWEGPRGVNRHRYSPEEAAEQLERPEVKALLQMCRFRNKHAAFNGQIAIRKEEPQDDRFLRVTWRNKEHFASLYADLDSCDFEVVASGIADAGQTTNVRYQLGESGHTWNVEESHSPLIPLSDLKGLRTDDLIHVDDFDGVCDDLVSSSK